MSKTNYIH